MRKIFNIWTIIATAVILMGAGTTYYSLKSTDSPIFANIKLSALSDGYIPYHVDDATGFADGPVKADVDDAVSKKHTRSHAISSTSDHSDVNLAAISNNDLMRWDDPSSKWLPKSIAEVVSGNIIDPSNVRIASLTDGYIPYHVDDTTGFADGPTKTDVDDAVSKKHSQNTDTGTTGASFTIESDAPDAGELYLGQDNAGVNGDNSAGIKNDSGTIKYKNKAGDWTAVGAGGGGDVSTDAIWDAAGDLAVGTGANTAAKVSIGAEEIVARIGAGNIDGISVAEQTIVGRKTGGSIDDLSAADVRTILNVADGAEVNNISDVNATDLTDGGDTTLHDHDGISENTAARHTQNTDTGTTQTSFTIDSAGGIVKKAGTTTSAAISKTIGSGGDYATFADAMAALPDMQSHNITLTILAGTTLTETCYIQNRHASGNVSFTVQAEKYFPTSGALPTVDSATATTLVDAALTGQSDDYYNGCWVLIVDGTGTDNGFVPITDYTDATGTCTVASWPGTQPDNTSRYLIVGALIDGESTRVYNIYIRSNTVLIEFAGVGTKNATSYSASILYNIHTAFNYCGFYNNGSGVVYQRAIFGVVQYCGLVGNTSYGIFTEAISQIGINYNGISDNGTYGNRITRGGFANINTNFGDNNGTWGTYAEYSGQARCIGTECSGSSGNHSNGTGDGSLSY